MNKKGITLVEIIISIVLISIVLIFLFSLLITVKDINDENEVNSTYLINKSLILKNIEEDFSKADTIIVSECIPPNPGDEPIKAIYSNYGTGTDYFPDNNDNLKANNCLKFEYGSGDFAYLGIYYYKNKESYVISYIHDDVKATRLLPDFEETFSIDSSNNLKSWTLNGQPIQYGKLTGFNIINIPIIGPDGKDYGINISYYKE